MKPILFALWALLIPAPFLVLGRIPGPCTLLSSVTLVALAWIQARDPRAQGDLGYARRIALGMSCGLGGDLAMGSGVVLLAMAVFAVGHVYYMRAMVAVARPRAVPMIVALAAGASVWYQLVLNGTSKAASYPAMVYGGLLYTLFLASMTGMAIGLASRGRAFIGLGVGGVLFLASDAVIAARMFSPDVFAALPDGIRADLVWLTYAPAQLLIVRSVRGPTSRLA